MNRSLPNHQNFLAGIQTQMHELSLIENIIDIILEEMPKHNLTRIESISLKVGQMRQVVPEALLFGFECLSKDTPLEGAELIMENIAIKGRCDHCEEDIILENWFDPCPGCGAMHLPIVAGKELEIVEFEGS